MKFIKILIMSVFVFSLVIPNSTLAYAENSEEVREVKSDTSMIITSLESGEAVGERFYETITTSVYNDNNELKEIVMKTKTTTVNWLTNEEIESYEENKYTFENAALTSVNDEMISDQKLDDNISDFSNGGVSTMHSGGISWATYYYKSSNGGYYLKSGQMKGYIDGGISGLLLDSSAAVPNSMITKHNYLTGDQGGLVATFHARADAAQTERAEIAKATVVLGGAGIALLTPAFWAGVASGGGAAWVIIQSYNSGMADIRGNYENIQAIRVKP